MNINCQGAARTMLFTAGMLVVFGLIIIVATGSTLIADELCEAPEGYEDKDGFHVVEKKRKMTPILISGEGVQQRSSGQSIFACVEQGTAVI